MTGRGPEGLISDELIDAEEALAPAPPVAAARRRLRAHPALVLLGVVLASLNMRAALAGVSPLLGTITDGYALTATAAGLVTTVPLITMALASPLAPKLSRRWGTEAVLCGALVLLCAGIGVRVLPPVAALFAGGAVVGAAIAMLNVLMPGLIKRDFPEKAAGMTALYSTAMVLGASASAAVAVPLGHLVGGWRGSLLSWALPAALAALVWLPQALLARRGLHHGEQAATPVPSQRQAAKAPGMSRSPLAWQVTLFMGLQSLVAYVMIAWMPVIFTDHGMDAATAGLVFAFSTLLQMAGSFVVPTLAGRMHRQRLLALCVVAFMAVGVVGLLLAPVAGAWVWAALLGVGQGGTLGLSLTWMVLRTRDAHDAARLSGMAQTWGYLVAAAGPLLLGAVHEVTGGWALPIVLLLAVCAALALLGLGAGRDRTVGGPAHGR